MTEPFVAIAPGLWVSNQQPAGYPMPRNTTVLRLADGGLAVFGASEAPEPWHEAVRQLGRPRLLVALGPVHLGGEADFRSHHPEVRVVGPRAALGAIARHVPVDGAVEDLAEPGLEVLEVGGCRPVERAFRAATPGGHALLVGDLLFNQPHLPGLLGRVFRAIGSTGFFGVTRLARGYYVRDARAYAAWLEAQAGAQGLQAVLMAHGTPVTADAPARLRAAAARLPGRRARARLVEPVPDLTAP